MRHLGRYLHQDSLRMQGAAAIEFVILLPLLLLILTGMVEFGRLMWHYDALAKATRDAARYLAEQPAPISIAARQAARGMVADSVQAAGVQGLEMDEVAASCEPSDCQNPSRVTVSVHYTFSIGGWVPLVGNPDAGGAMGEYSLNPYTTMRYMK